MHGNMEDLISEFGSLEQCCLHDVQWRPSDVTEIVAWQYEGGDWSEEEQVIVVALEGGSYGVLTASADTTGHGCQCGSDTVRVDSLHAALTHLTDCELRALLRG